MRQRVSGPATVSYGMHPREARSEHGTLQSDDGTMVTDRLVSWLLNITSL